MLRPLRFANFKFHPYTYGHPRPHPLSASQLANALDRLDFWTSAEIAPLVRSCSIRPTSQNYPPDEGFLYALLNVFFDRLPQFTGLTRLYASSLEFTQTGIVNLCKLPALSQVELSQCGVVDGEEIHTHSLTLRVSTFESRCDYRRISDIWITLLRPDYLQELTLDRHSALRKPAAPCFPNVHTLSLYVDWPEPSQVPYILAKFPGVRVFRTDWCFREVGGQPRQVAAIFPVLTEYIGHVGGLRVWILSTTLTHVTIKYTCSPREILAELRDPSSLNITSLIVTLAPSEDDDSQPVCNADLDELFILLPRLTEVRISICTEVEDNGGFNPQVQLTPFIPSVQLAERDLQPATFLKTLATTTALPPNLELLSIDWDFSAWDYGSTESTRGNEPAAPDSAQIPDFAALRDALIAKGPTLTTLHLDGYHFLFHWCGSLTNGTVKEATANNWDDAEVLRHCRTAIIS
ncbi:hypothetical protein B0H11DRAFT_2204329 [Mycena galericulata]|nr:hypothetical protein B0H11DRAFT_2204329 [Mycena galericulata]